MVAGRVVDGSQVERCARDDEVFHNQHIVHRQQRGGFNIQRRDGRHGADEDDSRRIGVAASIQVAGKRPCVERILVGANGVVRHRVQPVRSEQ